MKIFIYLLFGVVIYGSVMSCGNEKQDKDSVIFNLLRSDLSPSDTIRDFSMFWSDKRRTVNTDLYRFDIAALNRNVALVLDSIINQNVDDVEESIWEVLNNENIYSMFDIYKCWIVNGRFHWAVRPIHNSYGYSGTYRINDQSFTREFYAIFPFDSSFVKVQHLGVLGMLDDDENILFFGKQVENYVFLYRNLDRLLNIVDSLEANKEYNIRRDISTIY